MDYQMFIAIVCTNCGGSSQVAKAALGKLVLCPLCDKTTMAVAPKIALPVAQPVEETLPAPTPPAPLSLDDATPLPPKPQVAPEEPEPDPPTTPEPKKKRSPLRTALYTGVSVFITLLLMAAIYLGFRYGNAEIPSWAWSEYSLPEGNCVFQMPGEPLKESISSEGRAVRGGMRFTVKRWFERVSVSVGWIDLDADQLLAMDFDTLVNEFLERELKRTNGKIYGEHTVNQIVKGRKYASRRFQIQTEEGKQFLQVYFDADPNRLTHRIAVEIERRKLMVFAPIAGTGAGTWINIEWNDETKRRVVDPGQTMRLYFASAVGKKLTVDTTWTGKFFNSFLPE